MGRCDFELKPTTLDKMADREAPEDAAALATTDTGSDEDTDAELPATMEEGADPDFELTEEMISDLIEELVVDMNPVPQGWASVNSADNMVVQANNDAMAAAQAAHLEEDEIAVQQHEHGDEEQHQQELAAPAVQRIELFQIDADEDQRDRDDQYGQEDDAVIQHQRHQPLHPLYTARRHAQPSQCG